MALSQEKAKRKLLRYPDQAEAIIRRQERIEIIRTEDGRFELHDHGSRCGTFVNGAAVAAQVLTHGDQIRLGGSGEAELVFVLEEVRTTTVEAGTPPVAGEFRQLAGLLDGLRTLIHRGPPPAARFFRRTFIRVPRPSARSTSR